MLATHFIPPNIVHHQILHISFIHTTLNLHTIHTTFHTILQYNKILPYIRKVTVVLYTSPEANHIGQSNAGQC